MGEAYIVRRGGSGVDDDLAIYTGTVAPSNKPYGIWANTNNTISKIFLTNEAYSSGIEFVTKWANPASMYYPTPFTVGTTLYLINGSSGLWKSSENTNVWTTISSNIDSTNSRCMSTPLVIGNSAYWIRNISSSSNRNIKLVVTNITNGSMSEITTLSSGSTSYFNSGDIRGFPYNNFIYTNFTGDVAKINSAGVYTLVKKITYTISCENELVCYNNNVYYICGTYQKSDSSTKQNFYQIIESSGVMTQLSNFPNSSIRYADVAGIPFDDKIYFTFIPDYIYIYNISTNVYTSVSGGISQYSNVHAAKIGDYVLSTARDSFITYKIKSNTSIFPNGTLVIKNSGITNQATIYSSDKTRIDENIQAIYYSNGTTLSNISGQVRVQGGSWKNIS